MYVSPPFKSAVEQKVVYLVIFGAPEKCFYLKASHQKDVFATRHTLTLMGNERNVPEWINTISFIKKRSIEHGLESKWYKTSKGNTVELAYFFLSMDVNDGNTVQDMLDNIMKNHFGKAFKTRKRNTAGVLALNFSKTLGNSSDPKAGLFNWLCKNKSANSDAEVTAKNMTKEIDEHFAGGPVFHYDMDNDLNTIFGMHSQPP